MIVEKKKLAKAVYRLRGFDPLNPSSFLFIKKGEDFDEYIDRCTLYLVFKRLGKAFSQEKYSAQKKNYKADLLGNLGMKPEAFKAYVNALNNSPFRIPFGFIEYDASIYFGFYFDELDVENYKFRTKHTITDLYFIVTNSEYYGFRTSGTLREENAKYVHSHLGRNNLGALSSWCTGTTPMTKFLPLLLESSIPAQEWVDSFLLNLSKYVRTQSDEGGPHIHFEVLYNSSSSFEYNHMFDLSEIKELSKYFTFKYSGDIKVIIDGDILKDPEVIEKYSMYFDASGNVVTDPETSIRKIALNVLGPNITKNVIIKPVEVKKLLPKNFIENLKNTINSYVNDISRKTGIISSYNAERGYKSKDFFTPIDANQVSSEEVSVERVVFSPIL